MFQGQCVVIIFLVARDVFDDLEEWGEFHGLALGYALCLQYYKSFEAPLVDIHLEILSFPYKTVALLAYGATLWVGQREHHLIERQVDLAFRHQFFVF